LEDYPFPYLRISSFELIFSRLIQGLFVFLKLFR